MVRGISLALGIGLAILWVSGLGSENAPAWLVWVDLAASVCAFVVAGSAVSTTSNVSYKKTFSKGPFALSMGLFAAWVIALVTSNTTVLPWWNFAFACGFLLTAFLPQSEQQSASPVDAPHFRKSA